jgi:predicted DsbA family dithiol-disulfide isomerase
MMKVEIWSDVVCPWCYIGKRRFEAALAEFGHAGEVEVVWRSFELDPGAPRVQTEPHAERLARKYGVSLAQVEAMDARLVGEAKKEGLDFRLADSKGGNTFDAHRLIHFAAEGGRAGAMKERLMKAYFTEGMPIGERAELTRLAVDVGLDEGETKAVLSSDRYADDVRADEARARTFGISGVPFFAVDERYGISGAQPRELILEALQQAYGESRLTSVIGEAGAGECTDGSCAI